MKLYKIRLWNELYENSRSRAVSSLNWVSIPNRHDGETFTNIMSQKNGAEIYTGWILMVQIASKCTPRGTLIKGSGVPHDAKSLSVKCRADVRWIAAAIDYLEHHSDWLEVVEIQDTASGCHPPIIHLPSSRHPSAVEPSPSYHPSAEEQKGTEGKGREGTEGKNGLSPSAPPPARSSGKPDLETAKLYAAKIGLPQSEFNRWQNHYESNGWKVGRNPMKSPEASLRNWKLGWEERRGYPAGKTLAEKDADLILRKIDAI